MGLPNLSENGIMELWPPADERSELSSPETDTKGSDRVISRLDVERRADILATDKDNFYLMIENRQKEKGPVHCVLVDEAIANGRKIGGRFVFEGAQVAIEGEASVEYESLCARCYFKYKKEYGDRKRA